MWSSTVLARRSVILMFGCSDSYSLYRSAYPNSLKVAMVSSIFGPSSSFDFAEAEDWSLPPQADASRVRLQARATTAVRWPALGRMECSLDYWTG